MVSVCHTQRTMPALAQVSKPGGDEIGWGNLASLHSDTGDNFLWLINLSSSQKSIYANLNCTKRTAI